MSKLAKSKTIWINERSAETGTIRLEDRVYQVAATEYPNDIASERALLGAILLAGIEGNSSPAMRRIPFVRHDDFFLTRHGYIWRAMQALYRRGDEIDTLTVAALLDERKKDDVSYLDLVGGALYLEGLTNVVAMNIETYARNVVRHSLYRATIAAGAILSSLGQSGKMELEELSNELNSTIQDITSRIYALRGQHTHDVADALEMHVAQIERELDDDNFEPGIETGFSQLDDRLLGWRRQKMYVVAGSTGMGKSAFLLSSALHAYRNGKRIVFISLELTLEEITERILCIVGGINSDHLQRRTLNADERQRMAAAVQEVNRLRESRSFQIVCLRSPTMDEIDARLEDIYFQPGFDIIFLDYAGWNTIASESRLDTIKHTGGIYNRLNDYKVRYNCPVIVGCQISRDHEKRKNKRPMLSDLSDSSLIEKNADAVLFLFRPEKYESFPEYPGRGEVLVAKNRSGRGGGGTDVAYIRSELEFNRFRDWDGPNSVASRDLELDDL